MTILLSGKYIKDKCETCEGSGKVDQPKEVRIEVPGIQLSSSSNLTLVLAGISERERVRIAAHGHEIYVNFQIDQNSKFQRQGEHIHSTVDISISQAILGGRYMSSVKRGLKLRF